MKKEIIDINKEAGTFRCTTSDERWYIRPTKDIENGLPVYKFYPSSSWIVHYYYTSPFLQKWRDEKGADIADAIKIAAGEKGSKIHLATNLLEQGSELKMGDKLMNHNKGIEEELVVEEWEAILSYKNWFEKFNPQVIATEMAVFKDDEFGEPLYAGTLDNIMAIGEFAPGVRQIWILDKKTSKIISKGHMMQISSYKHAEIDYASLKISDEEWDNRKICTLQLGYAGNKDRYKFQEIPDKFNLFLNTRETWKEENPESAPKQINLPLTIKLNKPDLEKVGNLKIKKKK